MNQSRLFLSLKVCWEGKALDEINDLQEANGYVFANVFKEDKLYKIDPETGTVVGVYDFSSLYPKVSERASLHLCTIFIQFGIS